MAPDAPAAYFTRIGLAPPRSADLATLSSVLAAQLAAIPFENLDSYLGSPPRLDDASIAAKLVAGRRGGYCFEQNRLLWTVLEALGYRVEAYAARVVWRRPPGPLPPRTHMLLQVTTPDGPRLVDAGFGGLAVTVPLAFEPGLEQPGRDLPFRLERDGDDWTLHARPGADWEPLYRFDRHPQQAVDFEPINWFVATQPASQFTSTLIAARTSPARRLALRDREFTQRHADGRTTRETLADGATVVAVLGAEFGLDVGALPGLAARVDRLTGIS